MWKEIPGYEGLYSVNELGDVLSHPKRNGMKIAEEKILKHTIPKTGYHRVFFKVNKKQKSTFVHRCVALAFIPNPNNYSQVNHLDGNKRNNNVNNLEWCNASQNQKHSYNVLGKKKSRAWLGKFGKNHCSSKKIIQLDLNNKFIKEFAGQHEAQRETGIHQANITKCVNGKRNQAGGFKWQFA